jgi:hypothetical protein
MCLSNLYDTIVKTLSNLNKLVKIQLINSIDESLEHCSGKYILYNYSKPICYLKIITDYNHTLILNKNLNIIFEINHSQVNVILLIILIVNLIKN